MKLSDSLTDLVALASLDGALRDADFGKKVLFQIQCRVGLSGSGARGVESTYHSIKLILGHIANE
jgi:hypothetical protein